MDLEARGRGPGGAAGAVVVVEREALEELVSILDPPVLAAATVPLILLITFRFALAVTQRQPLGSIAWHPVSVAVAIIGQNAGIVDRVRGDRLGASLEHLDDEEVVHSVT